MKRAIRQLLRRAGYDLHRAKAPFMPYVRRFTFPGSTFDFWIANEDASWWYSETGWKTAGELKELTRLVKRGDRVLEIGAHHGFTGLLCANFAGPTGAVVAVEAHPWNAMVEAAQIGLNPSIKNLRFIHAAASDQEGRIAVVTEDHNSSVSVNNGAATVEVAARTGDALDAEFGPFDVLKIDVEGFETKVLKGCQKVLERRPKLALEVHIDELPKYRTTVAEVFALIHLPDYTGSMILRTDSDTVRPFEPSRMPEAGIVNLFLSPR